MIRSIPELAFSTLFLCAALIGYVWWYQWVAAESTQAVSLLEEVESKTKTKVRGEAALAALEELTAKQGAIENRFVSEGNIVTFLEELESIGVAQGARVRVSTVGTQSTEGGGSFPITVSIEGSFDTVMRTIGAIEYAPYAVVVSSIALQQARGEGVEGWGATVKIAVSSTQGTTTP